MSRILVVEDDPLIQKGLEVNLSEQGYEVLAAARAADAVSLCLSQRPDLVLLDVRLPDGDGFDVCKEIRFRGFANPIIFLTARSEEVDRVLGLELGADDYVTKPFGIRELLARIRARLRDRSVIPASLSLGGLSIDFSARRIQRDGKDIRLTAIEFDLLQYLVSFRGQPLTRERLLRAVWRYADGATSRTIDTHVQRLRRKIERDPASPVYIQSVYGTGYLFTG